MDASILEKIRQAFSHAPEKDNRSKIGPRAFLISLITGVVTDGNRKSIACIRRQLMSSLEEATPRSSFWERLTTKRMTDLLCATIRALVEETAKKLNIGSSVLNILGVTKCLLLDASSITLPAKAKKDFPAPRKNVAPAGIKWHPGWDLFSGSGHWFSLTDARTHDRNGFPPFEMPKGALIIFDLGYWDYSLLFALVENGCYFLSRVKNKAKIEITGVVTKSGLNWALGRNLFAVKWNKRCGNIIEFLGSIELTDKIELDLRVLGFWNQSNECYHWYITNLNVPAKLIYPLYRLRWQIELVFKSAKSSLKITDITSANYKIIINLTLASIIGNLTTGPISKAVLSNATDEVKMGASVGRSYFILINVAKELSKYLIIGGKKQLDDLVSKLLNLITEFVDPNYKNRPTSLKRLELALK